MNGRIFAFWQFLKVLRGFLTESTCGRIVSIERIEKEENQATNMKKLNEKKMSENIEKTK